MCYASCFLSSQTLNCQRCTDVFNLAQLVTRFSNDTKACVPIKRFSGIKKQPLPLLPPGLKIAHVPEIAHAEVGPGSDYRRGHLVGLGNISRWEIFFRKV